MALILLFIAFFCSLYGGYVFLDGFYSDDANAVWSAALSGMAWAAIPYLIGKTLAEMVAIRQRHLLLEQLVMQQAQIQQLLGSRTSTTTSASDSAV
jgi:hypothetical protein